MTERTEAVKLADELGNCYRSYATSEEHWLVPDDLLARILSHLRQPGWVKCSERLPEMVDYSRGIKPYVLVCDSKQRMAVAFAFKHSTGKTGWTSSKPIGDVTHWQPLPTPPTEG